MLRSLLLTLATLLFLWLPCVAPALTLVATLTPGQVVPTGGTDPEGISTASGLLTATFDPVEPRLDYSIELFGVSLLTEVLAIHLHVGAPGTNGDHVLNVFGLPSSDDADVVIGFVSNTVTGSYGDEDENLAAVGAPGVRDPGDSVALSGVVGDLLAGNFYVAVHTFDFPFPDTAELRGQIVPEPAAALLVGGGLAALAARRRGPRCVPPRIGGAGGIRSR